MILLSPPHAREAPPPVGLQRAIVPASSMSVTTSRWLGGSSLRGATKTSPIIYDQAVWDWLRECGMVWDDTGRKGRGPTRQLSDRDVLGEDLDDVPSKKLHPRWRGRLSNDPGHVLDHRARAARLAHELRVALRSRAAGAPVAHPNASPDRPGKLRRPRRSELLEKLSPEARARWEDDRFLDRALAHHAYDNVAPQARNMDKRDLRGNDGGWAHDVGAHEASKLMARRRAVERVQGDIDAYLRHGVTANMARKLEIELLAREADWAAWGMTSMARAVLRLVLQSRRWDSNAREWRYRPADAVLAAYARFIGIETNAMRGWLARELAGVRAALRPWAEDRTGGWIATPAPPAVFTPALEVWAMLKADGPPKNGRPRAHDPWRVAWALMLAEEISTKLRGAALAAIRGDLREDRGGVAEALHEAVAALIGQYAGTTLPTVAAIQQIVDQCGYGRRGAAKVLTQEVAALAYGLPWAALVALEKKAKAHSAAPTALKALVRHVRTRSREHFSRKLTGA
jgi:hypothetical protein